MSALVECHSGFDYAERPKAFVWEEARLEIVSVDARWRVPGAKFFRVRTKDERVFELIFDELNDEWQVHLI